MFDIMFSRRFLSYLDKLTFHGEKIGTCFVFNDREKEQNAPSILFAFVQFSSHWAILNELAEQI